MLSYLDIFISLVLNYLMALLWLNVNRNLLQIAFIGRSTLLNLQLFCILGLIGMHHRHVLDHAVGVGERAMFRGIVIATHILGMIGCAYVSM